MSSIHIFVHGQKVEGFYNVTAENVADLSKAATAEVYYASTDEAYTAMIDFEDRSFELTGLDAIRATKIASVLRKFLRLHRALPADYVHRPIRLNSDGFYVMNTVVSQTVCMTKPVLEKQGVSITEYRATAVDTNYPIVDGQADFSRTVETQMDWVWRFTTPNHDFTNYECVHLTKFVTARG